MTRMLTREEALLAHERETTCKTCGKRFQTPASCRAHENNHRMSRTSNHRTILLTVSLSDDYLEKLDALLGNAVSNRSEAVRMILSWVINEKIKLTSTRKSVNLKNTFSVSIYPVQIHAFNDSGMKSQQFIDALLKFTRSHFYKVMMNESRKA